MIQLFYIPNTRAGRVRWALEELGLSYELVLVREDGRDPNNPHPLQVVPFLKDGAVELFESTAICIYLADRYRDDLKLSPEKDDFLKRALFYQWLFFLMTELEPAAHRLEANPNAKNYFNERINVIERCLENHSYILVDGFSVVDIIAQAILKWANSISSLSHWPRIINYIEELEKRSPRIKSLRPIS